MFLAIGSYSDVKSRLVSSKLVYTFIGIEALLLAARLLTGTLPESRLLTVYVVVDIVLLLAFAVLVLMCLKGPGDLLMFLGVTLSEPFGVPLLPQPLVTLLYYSIASSVASLYTFALNMFDSRARSMLSRLPLHRKLYYALTARPVQVSKIVSGGWWIPLEIEEAKASVCRADVNPRQIVERLVEKGSLRLDDTVWATYGIPALLPMLAGYVMTLLIGDRPITWLLRMLTGVRS